MPLVPQARASALPSGLAPELPPSPWRLLRGLAESRPHDVAYVVGQDARTWAEVARTVERAAAGLVRSGLRADQVVVSLLPSAHPRPELETALRAIGAVVVHLAPGLTGEALSEALADVDVRLVLTPDEAELDRLAGLTFRSAEMFAVDAGWDRLLALGEERLRMDPDAVSRADRGVEPDGTSARVLAADASVGRVPHHVRPDLPATEATVVVGDHGDPLVRATLDAHLTSGGTLVHLPTPDGLAGVLAAVRPACLVLAHGPAAQLPGLAPSVPAARRLRPGRPRTNDVLRSWSGGRLATVVVDRPAPGLRDLLGGLEVSVELLPVELLPADLPVPPPVVLGDVADLPRRSRRDPSRDFLLDNDRAPAPVAPDESAFVLPSLPLFGGESFLDKLLIAQATQAGA
ncbi:hypothetical protein F4692_002064 [Nocardioides cavernae]|uniref:AMP-dependent synthetase/ligase domain-containing protein n=1 Tax=Nocardioides cavernae TaxID=1921566 RepID=A0A7Y9H3I5_9ACTN|nr:AMP-binding protein [Nocardioides cavernae]NYE36931.1 hypothetical protein [Nocardioides cavernae]